MITTTSCSDLSFFTQGSKSKHPIASTSSVVVKTRTVVRPAAYPTWSVSSESSASPPRKRKQLSDPPLPKEVKRLRASPEPEKPKVKRNRSGSVESRPASPEPIYRSRSTSILPPTPPVRPTGRRIWIEEDGRPGVNFQSAEVVVTGLMRKYKGYFKNLDDPEDLSFEPHPTDSPVVELEFPNTHAVERYLLLAPKDKDHYNPIFDLEKSLYAMVDTHMTPEQQKLFGRVPTDIRCDDTPPSSPSPSPPSSVRSSSSKASAVSMAPPTVNYLRAIQRSIHLHDGRLFMKTMAVINRLLRVLKYPRVPTDVYQPRMPNALHAIVKTWSRLDQKVGMRIIDETYQRCVGPKIASLKQYEAFSSEVYGELMPMLAGEIFRHTGLNENSLFVDLGSGVGNIVIQASLVTGCQSFGIELMRGPAEVAATQLDQVKTRCRMWGVSMGEVELVQGDMLTHPKVNQLLSKADVVLVNNKVFLESLNEALRPKFLDLKEGAIVVSLKPFVHGALNARVTERNIDDISAIFEVTKKTYIAGSVSWGAGGGEYYLHRVDREGYSSIRERFESSRGSSLAVTGTRTSSRNTRRW